MDGEEGIYVLGESMLDVEDDLILSNPYSRKRKREFALVDNDEVALIGGSDSSDDDAIDKEIIGESFSGIKEEFPGSNITGAYDALQPYLLMGDEEPPNALSRVEQDGTLDKDVKTEEDGYFIEHMDIRAPVSVLWRRLGKRLGADFSSYEIWLQNAQKLEPSKNLVDQCVQGEGFVQINLEVLEVMGKHRINIVDVLKPTEEFMKKCKEKEAKKGVQWVEDKTFEIELNRLNIPADPQLWTKEHVKHWLLRAVRQFNISGIKLADWTITGHELCNMSLETFKEKCPRDRDSLFWTHLQLLRTCNVYAVVDKLKVEPFIEKEPVVDPNEMFAQPQPISTNVRPHVAKKSRILGSNQAVTERRSTSFSSRAGNNGQIQLWQFLLELLTDKNHRNVIHWLSDSGEFKLEDPEMVAVLWGQRKKKPAMTYDKLSRALRYYYDGDMIAKVSGKRFVYQFVCDVKELIGYSPAELNSLVNECAAKHGLPDSSAPEFFERHVPKKSAYLQLTESQRKM